MFANAAMHVPIDTARAARDKARELGADVYVAVGGGSTIGLGKAIALETSNPIVAVPTTFAGSEMTPIYGLTDYDPTLTLTLPADGLDKAADLAMQNPYDNPRPLDRSAIRQLIENAYHGTRPE